MRLLVYELTVAIGMALEEKAGKGSGNDAQKEAETEDNISGSIKP